MAKIRYNSTNLGFTLLETTIVLIIMAIAAAISAPNLIGLYNRVKLNGAVNDVVSAIKETQMQARRQSKTCRIQINANALPEVDSITNSDNDKPEDDCLLSDRIFPKEITVEHNNNSSINFGHRGNTTTNKTIRLSADYVDQARCIVISMPLGIVRTGYYDDLEDSITASKCHKLATK